MTLTIRAAQIEAIQSSREARFELQMVDHLRTVDPERYGDLGEDGARGLVRRVIARGKESRVVEPGALLVLLELVLELGERFELCPDRAWAQRMLAHATLPGPVKVDAIRERVEASTGGRKVVRLRPEGPP